MDFKFDVKHPVKKNRPIAAGLISIPQATFLIFVLTLVSLLLALVFSPALFVIAFAFILLHFFYSMFLKKYPIIDIFTISFSFMIRTLAGEVASGYHIPIFLSILTFY
jgi:4-hydroxybenzoate polyprenyltransferase